MKSHVSLEQHQCPICGKVHDTGALLLDKRLRQSLERHTVTGLSPCPECAERLKEYVAMIVVARPCRSLRDADRTGETLWVRREAWSKVFNSPVPEKGIALCGQDTVEALRKHITP